MKFMLRPEWRLWPLSSFFGLLDLKTGVTVALLFALLNKVAGVYGLIAVLTGAGGSFAQLSLYIYSVLALLALAWGLRAVKNEDPKHTFYFAHLFFADHILSTAWTVFFAVAWWVYNPHDGRRQANSAAQKALIELSGAGHALTDEERKDAAMEIWNHEKGRAAVIIVVSWLFKIYFALLIYSYATHLRKGTYRSLPLSRSAGLASSPTSHHGYESALGIPEDEEDEEIEDFYRVPLRKTHRSTPSSSSFADFVAAPSKSKRSRSSTQLSSGKSGAIGRSGGADTIPEDDMLFDEDEMTYAGSSRGHSKMSTDESATNVDTDEEQGKMDPDSSRTAIGKSRD